MSPNNIETLIIIPTEIELDAFIKEFDKNEIRNVPRNFGPLIMNEFLENGVGVTLGGLGKVQSAVQTQFCINKIDSLKRVLCIGAAGGLKNGLYFGDVVVATETVEHDIKKQSRPLIPRFSSDEKLLKQFVTIAEKVTDFKVHFGTIASGDEDIMSETRKNELRSKTGAIAVAWEGAGVARSCLFSKLPFVEIRGITDSANQNTSDDFFKNLELVMSNLARVIMNLDTYKNNG